jgi:anhydro-N-acetylmuramic acid kinase
LHNLKIEDALATFAYIHARAIRINCELLASHGGGMPKNIFVCGGGRKNVALMSELRRQIPEVKIKNVDDVGFNGDATEAEAFAFLAIRRLLKLPISFQKTTGISPAGNYAQALPQRHFSSYGGVFYPA